MLERFMPGRPGQAGPPRERPLHEGRDAEIAEP